MTEEQSKCVFCRIVAGSIPAAIVYRDAEIIAFRDIHPLAPTHILIVPRAHIPSMNEAGEAHAALLGRMMLTGRKLAETEKVAGRGYRMVVNSGPEGGQIVPHLHLHLLAGRRLDDELG
jgi:histidine triad (HIT) family protein